jgi:para-nitrobenzyl esterase
MNRQYARLLAGAIGCGIAVAGLAVTGQAEAGRSDSTVVTTDNGPVRGTAASDYRLFQGIPYAAPPVGELRWASPRPAARWTAVRDASKPGSACPQTAGFLGDPPSETEDCLYLNVTVPRRADSRKRPVMVWIHGGGFYSGAGDIYGAQQLATRGDVVVVTLNYRLGVFGFLAHPSLDGGPGQQLSGNYGLEDQQAALRWVRRNAAAFGGDPASVTLFGESAGGVSTCAHLTAPGSAGLFQRAIIQSGPCALTTQWPYPDGTWVSRPRATAERAGATVAARLGCANTATVPACLRAKPVPALLDASDGGQGFGPVVGGGVLPTNPAQALATGRFQKVPVMQGTTRDEHRTFQAAIDQFTGHPATAAEYRDQLTGIFGPEKAARVLARYPVSDYGTPSLALATVWTDYSWACTGLHTDRLLASQVPTYAYEFADEQAPWFAGAPTPSFPTGAYHASELQYLFSGGYASGVLSPAQQRLSDQMISYWTRFAHTGNPNGPATPAWPQFRPSGQHVQSLTTGPQIRPAHMCDFWQV